MYVWPQRVPSEGEVPSDGHYRERRDAVWHPHPVYRLVEQVIKHRGMLITREFNMA